MEAFKEADVLPHLNFLRKGDRFMLWSYSSLGATFRHGTVWHDGSAVSKQYGWVGGNHYYDDPEKTYINVQFDDVKYEGYNTNESIYVRPGLYGEYGKKMTGWGKLALAGVQLFVAPDVYQRIMKESMMTPEQLHPELVPDVNAEVKAQIAGIEAQMNRLATELAEARGKLA
jgi:hypothetical protein